MRPGVFIAMVLLFMSDGTCLAGGYGGSPGWDPSGMGISGRSNSGKSCITPDYLLANRDEIGLTGGQVDSLKAQDLALSKNRITKGAAVKSLELELTAIVSDPDFSEQAALAKLAEIEKARTELRTAVIKSSAASLALLDGVQKDALKGLIDRNPPGRRPGRAGRTAVMPDMEPGPADEDDMQQMMKQRMMREMMDGGRP